MRTIIIATAIMICTAANAQSEDDWETRLDEYLSVSGLRLWAYEVGRDCVNAYMIQIGHTPSRESYRELVLTWGRERAKGDTRLAKLREESVTNGLGIADDIIMKMDRIGIETKQDRAAYADWYVGECEIMGIKALAKKNQ